MGARDEIGSAFQKPADPLLKSLAARQTFVSDWAYVDYLRAFLGKSNRRQAEELLRLFGEFVRQAAAARFEAWVQRHAGALGPEDSAFEPINFRQWVSACESCSQAELVDKCQFIADLIHAARGRTERYCACRQLFLDYAEAALWRRFGDMWDIPF